MYIDHFLARATIRSSHIQYKLLILHSILLKIVGKPLQMSLKSHNVKPESSCDIKHLFKDSAVKFVLFLFLQLRIQHSFILVST